ncbi:50S ribosomal protein L28 [Candidatus Falkowbacteria bacterium]|jgi:large subunit ribosomal protein L28|nr:50S ribosomal protein L28 [Candidatus Falkowbacteria bacterium]MBT7007126.1 50S ribosomal protein L28 [Candidatus Falkowbacteria bacterium]
MSRVCEVCGRGPKAKISRSHALNKTKTVQRINLQSKTIDGTKVKVCTKCIKTMSK